MAIWELQESGSISHDITVQKTLPTNNNSYGAEYVYDLSPPDNTVTLNATPGISATELQSLRNAANTRNAVVTCTDSTGVTHTGRITALSWEVVPGSNLYSASLTLRGTAFESSSNAKNSITLTF